MQWNGRQDWVKNKLFEGCFSFHFLGCSIAGFINVFASELSIVSMFMISIEIYYNAKFAFYGKRMSALVAYGTITAGYIYAIVAAGKCYIVTFKNFAF